MRSWFIFKKELLKIKWFFISIILLFSMIYSRISSGLRSSYQNDVLHDFNPFDYLELFYYLQRTRMILVFFAVAILAFIQFNKENNFLYLTLPIKKYELLKCKLLSGILVITFAVSFGIILPTFLVINRNLVWIENLMLAQRANVIEMYNYSNSVLIWQAFFILYIKLVLVYLIIVLFNNIIKNKLIATIFGYIFLHIPLYVMGSIMPVSFTVGGIVEKVHNAIETFALSMQITYDYSYYGFLYRVNGEIKQGDMSANVSNITGFSISVFIIAAAIILVIFLIMKAFGHTKNLTNNSLIFYEYCRICFIFCVTLIFIATGFFIYNTFQFRQPSIIAFLISGLATGIVGLVLSKFILKLTSESK